MVGGGGEKVIGRILVGEGGRGGSVRKDERMEWEGVCVCSVLAESDITAPLDS